LNALISNIFVRMIAVLWRLNISGWRMANSIVGAGLSARFFDWLRGAERRFRQARDDLLIKRIARSRMVHRQAIASYRMVVLKAHDHLVAFDPRDPIVGRRVRQTGGWRRSEFDSVLAALAEAGVDTRGKVFLDTGANIGTQSLYALLSTRFAKAIAIEPVEANLLCLRANVVLNGLSDRFEVVAAAAGAKRGIARIFLSPENCGAHSLKADRRGGAVDVEVAPVDEILAAFATAPSDVGLWWLDIEGYEPEALAGGESLLAARVPICLEFNAEIYGPEATDALLAKLARTYSRVAILSGGGERLAIQQLSEFRRSDPLGSQHDLLILP
jgi:FkbM family methyltransferase